MFVCVLLVCFMSYFYFLNVLLFYVFFGLCFCILHNFSVLFFSVFFLVESLLASCTLSQKICRNPTIYATL